MFLLGENGWWIGAVITIVYFSVFQSKIGKGASVGYRIMRLEVIGENNEYLSIQKSLIRSFFLSVIYFGTDALGLISQFPVWSLVLGDIFFAYVIATTVFVVFHPLHRGLHDVLSGAFVVNKKPYDLLTIEEKHFFTHQPIQLKKIQIISAALILLMIIVTFGAYFFVSKNAPYSIPGIYALEKTLNQIPGVTVMSISDMTYYTGDHTKVLSVQVSLDRADYVNQNKRIFLAQQIEDTILHNYPNIKEDDFIDLKIISGYDLGIVSYNENLTDEESIPDLLQGKSNLASTTQY